MGSYIMILSKSNYRVRLNVNMNIVDSISFYPEWQTGDETLTPKRGSRKHGANKQIKHTTAKIARKAVNVW